MSTRILPVADRAQVRAYARRLALRHPRELSAAIGLHGLTALSSLVAPRLLGELVEGVRAGGPGDAGVDIGLVSGAIGAFFVLQGVLARFAVYTSAKLGEKVLAELREELVSRVLALPLSTVERAGSGDLISRASRDVEEVSYSVRQAVPETLIAIVTGFCVMGALVLAGPLLMLPSLLAAPILLLSSRWYLRRARDGYLRVSAAYAQMIDGLAETVDGARTVEAFGLQERRRRRTDEDIAGSWAAERYTSACVRCGTPASI